MNKFTQKFAKMLLFMRKYFFPNQILFILISLFDKIDIYSVRIAGVFLWIELLSLELF